MFIDTAALESRVQEFGRSVYDDAQGAKLGIAEFYTEKLMDWSMQDEEFKVSLFRFVDVFPALQESSALIRHAQEYFRPVAHRIPGIVKWGLNVDPSSISAKLAAPIISHQIRSMAERFIVGETPKGALKALRKIRQSGMAFTVDLLGEATVGEGESEEYLKKYLELVTVLSKEVPQWRESRAIIEGHKGERAPVNISVKLSALYSQVKPIAFEKSVDILSGRLTQILLKAKESGTYVFIDMEDTSFVDITLESVKRALSTEGLKDYDRCGFVLQAYLRRTEEDIDQLLAWARARGVPVGIRLVKGAYWDTETVIARQKGWEVPVWESKSSTDACYERITVKLLQNTDVILPAFASHNIRSLSYAAMVAELLGVPKTDFELQALFGMAEPVKEALKKRGFLIREYAPVGELIPGMSYLVRRLLENTSNEGFLRQTFRENETPEKLLKKPESPTSDTGRAHLETNHRKQFVSLAPADFSLAAERDAFRTALKTFRLKVENQPERVVPVISGAVRDGKSVIETHSPEDRALRIASVSLAGVESAEEAVSSLRAFFPQWRDTPVSTRAEILFKAADLMEKRRHELSAVIVYEAGKPWIEADADLCEAVDFLRYYAHEALKLFEKRRLGELPGEYNTYFYEPRGVTAVIAPWNFPLAIPCGMFAAALVTGNCAVLKPAEQSSLIARYLFDTFIAAGLPEGAAAFLPGYGEDVGPKLVSHPKVSTVVFTGSKEVGLKIIQSSGVTPIGADHVKRVIAEMGGKNAIIVDDGADLDEAVKGVIYSAFGFSGQKCSACSRVFVLDSIYERFVSRLKEAAMALVIGPASDPSSFLGPVIDDEAYSRLRAAIDGARSRVTLLCEGGVSDYDLTKGYFVRPTIFTDLRADDELLTRELFGPILAVAKVRSFDHALELALDTEYRLTGGVFSRSPVNIQKAIEQFRVGNLYINRGCTGALVYRQPFGGAHMSGVGSKAGGPDYLQQFVIPRSISENTMRRGFAPKVEG